MAKREEMWGALEGDFDLLIVGGGINGAGIARDAALRGLKVAVVEKFDLAYGTSSRSSKLIHGGLRYLETYEISLVFESVSERRIVMDQAPHLVNPLGFVFPVYTGAKHNLAILNAGMWIYDALSLFRSPKIHRLLKPSDLAELEPAVRQEGLKGAPLYYDCSTDDARLVLENALDAVDAGAVVATWTEVVGFVKDEGGRVSGAEVKNRLSGETRVVRASAVINATGPWTDEVLGMSVDRKGRELLRPTKGIHVVVDAKKLPIGNAIVIHHPGDGRLLFAIPWGDRTYLGTTDTDFEGGPEEVAATSEDVNYLVDAANAHFPDFQLRREDVIATWAGLRPLIAPHDEGHEMAESQVSREHQTMVGNDGIITIAGGKLTTYRRMSKEVVDTAIRMLQLLDRLAVEPGDCETAKRPLPGAVGWPEDDDAEKVAKQILEDAGGAITADIALHLANTYGTRGRDIARLCAEDPELATPLIEGRPEIRAQVTWAVADELAATVEDVMTRRTQLFFRDVDQGLGCADAVASQMADLLGWDDAERMERLEGYRHEVARARRWRDG